MFSLNRSTESKNYFHLHSLFRAAFGSDLHRLQVSRGCPLPPLPLPVRLRGGGEEITVDELE